MANRVTILSAATTDANGSTVVNELSSDEQTLHVVGTGTFTFKLELLQPDGTTWLPVRDLDRNTVSITASEELPISIGYGRSMRGVTSGTSGASVSAWLSQRKKRGS